MADVIFNGFKKHLFAGDFDLDANTIKMMLVTSAYTPNQDTHEFRSSVTNEVAGTGYTAGGVTLTNKTVTQDDTNNRAAWDFDDAVWASATITARGAVVYKDTGSAATDILICYIDFGSDKTSTAGEFRVAVADLLRLA